MFPRIAGSFWTIARDPDLGALNGPPADHPERRQEPVDFSIWQAADGTWQLWSCIRNTRCEGNTRLLYRWEGQHLTDSQWQLMGIAMQADPGCGETPGGLQAPHVIKTNGLYHMFYGDWVHICLQRSTDGKHFTRWLYDNGQAGMFDEGPHANARDPATLRIGDTWYCYYAAVTGGRCAVYLRTSEDLRQWTASCIVARGGLSGLGPGSAECPHVVAHLGYYYLFRTQSYRNPPVTSVYRSRDPRDFGVDTDTCFIGLLPVGAPEIIHHGGRDYIAALCPDVQGIRIAPLTWLPDPSAPTP